MLFGLQDCILSVKTCAVILICVLPPLRGLPNSLWFVGSS